MANGLFLLYFMAVDSGGINLSAFIPWIFVGLVANFPSVVLELVHEAKGSTNDNIIGRRYRVILYVNISTPFLNGLFSKLNSPFSGYRKFANPIIF